MDLKQQCSKKLIKLAANITNEDKDNAEKEIPVSRPTLDKYLKGDVVKLDIAVKLIKFLSARVKKNQKSIAV
jgi:hypothetical protein